MASIVPSCAKPVQRDVDLTVPPQRRARPRRHRHRCRQPRAAGERDVHQRSRGGEVARGLPAAGRPGPDHRDQRVVARRDRRSGYPLAAGVSDPDLIAAVDVDVLHLRIAQVGRHRAELVALVVHGPSEIVERAAGGGGQQAAADLRSSQRCAVSRMTGMTSAALAPSSSCAAIIAVISVMPRMSRGSVSPARTGTDSCCSVPAPCASAGPVTAAGQGSPPSMLLRRRRRPVQPHLARTCPCWPLGRRNVVVAQRPPRGAARPDQRAACQVTPVTESVGQQAGRA